MLKILIRKQIYELNSSFFYDRKKGTARSKISSILLIALYAFLMIVVIGGMFTFLSYTLCRPFVALGLDWLYFDIMTLTALLLGIFGSVFNTYSSLYKAKDNDLMLSLPVPARYILISRLTGVCLMGLMFTAVVMLPAIVVYFIIAKPALAGIAGCLLLTLLAAVFVFTLSCILGWGVAKISVHLKSRSLVVVLLSLVFFGFYYFFFFNLSEYMNALIANAAAIGEEVRSSAHILYIIGRCGEGDPLSMLYLTTAVSALFAATCFALSRSFIKIATSSDKTAKRVYRARTAKMRSSSSALLFKESARLLSSPTYMLNCALGTPLLIAAGTLLLIKDQELTDIAAMLPLPDGLCAAILCFAVCLLCSICDLTAPSVSLEGRSLWIAQSLPVHPQELLRAKLRLHLLLTAVPALYCSVCVCMVFRPDALTAVACLVLPPVFTLFTAALGLIVGLEHPNLNWQSETSVVKQSVGVLVTVLSGNITAVLGGCGCYVLSSRLGTAAAIWLICAAFALISAIELKWLLRKGSEILRYL